MGGARGVTERVVNLMELALESDAGDPPPGHAFTGKSLTDLVGATATGMAVYEIEPGNLSWPYHFHLTQEEFLFVLSGELTLRTPEGERVLRTGDIVWFPAGAEGAHTVRNHSDAVVRYVIASSQSEHGGGSVYPDSGKVSVWTSGFHHLGRLGERAEYWEGEP